MSRKHSTPRTANGLIIPEGVIFYYVRYNDNRPFACVALAAHPEGRFCRGVSICSEKDQFCRKVARQLAYGRLCKAFGKGQTLDPVVTGDFLWRSTERLDAFYNATGIGYKTGYNVQLTEYEQKLVESAMSKTKEEDPCSIS